MNMFGIGNIEIFIILVVSLIVLGPERMVDIARQAGRLWRQAQMMMRTIADESSIKMDQPTPLKTSPPREPVPEPEDTVARSSGDDSAQSASEEPTQESGSRSSNANGSGAATGESKPRRTRTTKTKSSGSTTSRRRTSRRSNTET